MLNVMTTILPFYVKFGMLLSITKVTKVIDCLITDNKIICWRNTRQMFVQTNLDITQQKRFYFRGKKEKKKTKKQNKPVGQQGSFHISFCSPSPSLSAFSIPLFRPLKFNFILFPPLVLFLSSFFLFNFFIIVLKQRQLRNPFP